MTTTQTAEAINLGSVGRPTALGLKVERALGRLGEGAYERWIDRTNEFEAAGSTSDEACCLALDVLLPGWRRFRR